MTRDQFAKLPPQGYAYLTSLQRFDYQVRLAALDVLKSGEAGSDNIQMVLGRVLHDIREVERADAKVEEYVRAGVAKSAT